MVRYKRSGEWPSNGMPGGQKGFEMKRYDMHEELLKEMREQTIGVEVEMNSIKRSEAAKVVSAMFGTDDCWYAGGNYDAWHARDVKGRVWKFMSDASIDGPYAERCEMVTPVLTYEDMGLLQEAVRVLRKAGAKSDASRCCGVHIHLGTDGHTAKTLRNLANVMASHESLLIDAIGIGYSRMTYCAVTNSHFLRRLNASKPKTMEALKKVWYTTQGSDEYYGPRHHYDQTRYHMLNYHAVFSKGTIEFRLFQFDQPSGDRKGGLHAGQLKAYIQLCLALSCYAKHISHAKWEQPTARDENPKYVMRFWMKTMGMIGDEFQTARDLYVSRLAGNSDCRSGRRAA